MPWLLLLTLAALVLLPAAARASGDGGDKSGPAGKAAGAGRPGAARRGAAAEADPTIAAVLAGKDATVESAAWGGTEAQPAGSRSSIAGPRPARRA